jgi:uncharacterized protein YhbP (UPF0306 family)
MTSPLPESLQEYIRSHWTLTLATAHDDRPWAAAVFYVCDARMHLYFVSDPGTRHARHGAVNPNVAAAIHEHDHSWHSIRGVQIEGRLSAVPPAERRHVEALYIERFPVIGRLLRAATTDAERLVGQRFVAATFYELTPGLVRFIDNRRGFGHKDEYVVDSGARHR